MINIRITIENGRCIKENLLKKLKRILQGSIIYQLKKGTIIVVNEEKGNLSGKAQHYFSLHQIS